jgi:hypothetical protein
MSCTFLGSLCNVKANRKNPACCYTAQGAKISPTHGHHVMVMAFLLLGITGQVNNKVKRLKASDTNIDVYELYFPWLLEKCTNK